MRNVKIYDLNIFIQTCGAFFMIQYLDEEDRPSEPCRMFVGCAGPASLDLPTKLISFCYIGPFSRESFLVSPAVWNVMPDGVKECDALEFLKTHQIPFRVNWHYLNIRKAEQYFYRFQNGWLGNKGLLCFNKDRYKRKSGMKEIFFDLKYFLSPGCIPDTVNPSRSVKSVNISHITYKEVPDDYLVSPFFQFEQAPTENLEEFMQRIPSELNSRFDFYPVLSENRQENFACRDHSFCNKDNVLILSDFFNDEVQIFMAWSVTPAMCVPCYVQIRGDRYAAEIPWEADLENTFFIFLNRESRKYLFQPVAFEKRPDGSFCCCLTDVLKENGIVLKPKRKGEFRKNLMSIRQASHSISAGPNGFCLATSSWMLLRYGTGLYSISQYLQDCEICGHKIRKISTGLADDWRDNRLFWLPDSIEQLFRWGGKITEEKLLQEGEMLLSRRLYFETEKGILVIDCEKRTGNSERPQTLQVIRENRVTADVDVDGLPWHEKAEALINLLHSF